MIDDRIRRRRSIRLADYDYAQAGAYFLTICAHGRQSLFGRIEDGEMRQNRFGVIALETWNGLPAHYSGMELDVFVVMPNHVHGIVVLIDGQDVGTGLKPAPKNHPLSEIVRGFKTFSARRINELRGTPGATVWQRNYYEHVIRNESALNRIRRYIADNPSRWADDPDNPALLDGGRGGFETRGKTDRCRGGFETRPYKPGEGQQ